MGKRTIRETIYKSEDGKTFYLASMKRTIVRDGVTYVRQPRPKPLSRSARAAQQADEWRGCASELEELKSQLEEDFANNVTDMGVGVGLMQRAQEIVDTLDFSGLEELTEEMTSWRDNMSGTALENTSKYSEVEEAASTLEGIEADCSTSIESPDDIDEVVRELEEKADELEGVDFPGMY
jgi:DNA repair exonuclease SbcCD ATPase subunit